MICVSLGHVSGAVSVLYRSDAVFRNGSFRIYLVDDLSVARELSGVGKRFWLLRLLGSFMTAVPFRAQSTGNYLSGLSPK